MKKISFRDRLRYRFDNTMSKGTIAVIGWLFVAAFLLIVGMSLIVYTTKLGFQDRTFFGIMWETLMRTLGTGAVGRDKGSVLFMSLMLLTTFGGIFTVSILIGLLTTGIKSKIDDFRKGRSYVTETGHVIILGWSSQIFTVISELVIANENKLRSSIVVLAQKDKIQMEDAIRDKVGTPRRTRIVCRTGNPIDLTDLEIANPDAARSIIILAPETKDPDIHVIKSVLALVNRRGRRSEPYHIIAAVRDPKNLEVARMVGKDEAQFILASDLIARIAAQSCRQSGLSVVYTELLDFGGDEIYLKEEPSLVGKTFGDALFDFEDSSIIGLRFSDGTTRLNPPMDTMIGTGDQLIAISEDDDTIILSGLTDWGIDKGALRHVKPKRPAPVKILILGWNHRTKTIIRELDSYLAPGSQITVVADDIGLPGRGPGDQVKEIKLKNASVSSRLGDITDRSVLNGLAANTYDDVIVLSYSDTLDAEQADANTLICLLHLRDINEKGGNSFNIVSEMLDMKNRDLAEVTHADDFIISDRLVSLAISQIAENRELSAVFADLFDSEGSEIYMKPSDLYVRTGRPVNFYTVIESARVRGEIAIGYRIVASAHDVDRSYGVTVNPDKSDLITFEPDDRIIVLAND
jgi:voltage-gated potassium channel Kch